jgi:hypothetical protein
MRRRRMRFSILSRSSGRGQGPPDQAGRLPLRRRAAPSEFSFRGLPDRFPRSTALRIRRGLLTPSSVASSGAQFFNAHRAVVADDVLWHRRIVPTLANAPTERASNRQDRPPSRFRGPRLALLFGSSRGGARVGRGSPSDRRTGVRTSAPRRQWCTPPPTGAQQLVRSARHLHWGFEAHRCGCP